MDSSIVSRLGVLALVACCSCTAPAPMAPTEWIGFTAQAYRPEGPVENDYNDALGLSIGGGLDLNGDRISVAWEIEGAWSQHDVESGGIELENDYDILRISTGLRVHSRLESYPLGMFVRGGIEWRDEDSDSDTLVGADMLGTYFGAGLEWWYSPIAAMGPTVSWFYDEDGHWAETRLGLAVRFY